MFKSKYTKFRDRQGKAKVLQLPLESKFIFMIYNSFTISALIFSANLPERIK